MQTDELHKVDYFVEATLTEMELLQTTFVERPDPKLEIIPEWENIHMGFGRKLATSYVAFRFACLYGKLVAFYEPISSQIDWNEVTDYLESYKKKKCRASDFIKCILYCSRN